MTAARSSRAIPLAARLGFSLWMLCWVAVILSNQGPQNFFWLCNMAQFLILYGIWSGNRLILSSQAGTVVLVGVVWTLDFVSALLLGGSLTGFTDYMFNPDLSPMARASSFYHVALPPFLLWLLWRIGYDRRGPRLQSLIGIVGILGAWLLTEPYRNVNWFYQPLGIEQAWFPDPLWALILMLLYPLCLYFPGHALVLGVFRMLGNDSAAGRSQSRP